MVYLLRALMSALYALAIIAVIVGFFSLSGSRDLSSHLVAYVEARGDGSHGAALLCFLEVPGGLDSLRSGGFVLRVGLGLATGFYRANVSLGVAASRAVCTKLLGFSPGGLFAVNVSRIALAAARPYVIGYGLGTGSRVVLFSTPLLFLVAATTIYVASIIVFKRVGEFEGLQPLAEEVAPFTRALGGRRERLLVGAWFFSGSFVLFLIGGYPSLAVYSLGLSVLLALALILDYLVDFVEPRNKWLYVLALLFGLLTIFDTISIIIRIVAMLLAYALMAVFAVVSLLYISTGKAGGLYKILLVFMYLYVVFIVLFLVMRSGFLAALLAAPPALMVSLALPVLLGFLDAVRGMLLSRRRAYLSLVALLAALMVSLGAASGLVVEDYYWREWGLGMLFATVSMPLVFAVLGYLRAGSSGSSRFWRAVELGFVGVMLEALLLNPLSRLFSFRFTAVLEVLSWSALLAAIVQVVYVMYRLYDVLKGS